MADIEIVIKLPEDSYRATCNGCMLPPDVENVVQGIKNGTLLPKGHGSLIDIQDVMKKVSLNYNSHQLIDAQSIKDIIRTTKIIIEADKEG